MKNKILTILVFFTTVAIFSQKDSTRLQVIKTISNTDSTKNSGSVRKKVLNMFISDTVPPVKPVMEYKPKIIRDTIKPLDSIKVEQLGDSIKIFSKLDSLGVYQPYDTVPILTALDSLRIELNSLLQPFYDIQYDSLQQKQVYKPRYRIVINNFTKDTSYVSLPKATNYLTTSSILQIDTVKVLNPIRKVEIDAVKYAEEPIWWEHRNTFGIDINEATFHNWNAGGNNSISGLAHLNLQRTYKKLHLLWNNEAEARYGINNQEGKGWRKTDDKLQFTSTFGYRRDTISNWFYSVKFNFKTQFTNGYRYPNTKDAISKFFAPAYVFLGAGSHYEIKQQKFSLYLSPVTLKSTFVLDKTLSNQGAFGVTPGNHARHEFGILMESTWYKEIFEDVLMTNKISLYSDYLNNFGNVDIDWQLSFGFKINDHIKTTLGGHLIYDDDVKFKEDRNNDGTLETYGARLQLKQLLSIGVMFKF